MDADRMVRDAACTVYNQYWQHARHVENQLHSFVGFYVAIVGGALVFSAANGDPERIAAGLFVFLLSILGLLFNYNLRIPFIKFTLLSELIAIRELGLKDEYRRFFDRQGNLVIRKSIGSVPIDTYEMFAGLFVLVAAFSAAGIVFFAFEAVGGVALVIELVAAALLAGVIVVSLGRLYRWTKEKLEALSSDVEKEVKEEAKNR